MPGASGEACERRGTQSFTPLPSLIADRRLEVEQQGDERHQGSWWKDLQQHQRPLRTYTLPRWPGGFAGWDKSVGSLVSVTHSRVQSLHDNSASPGLLVCRGQSTPFLLMLVWVGFSVTFNRRHQISGSEISCSLSRHIALYHICETRWATAVLLRERRWYFLQTAEAHHPGLQRNTKTGRGNGRKSWERAKGSLKGGKNLFQL